LADLEKRQTFPENPEGMKLKEEHRLSCNPERLFLEETCVWNDEGKVSTKRLYSAYQNYCKESGFRPRHQENFNRAVLLAFPKARKARCSQLTGNPTVWYGIKFTEDSVI
jgi:phage/plasmid-associated DNA primase